MQQLVLRQLKIEAAMQSSQKVFMLYPTKPLLVKLKPNWKKNFWSLDLRKGGELGGITGEQ